MANPFTKITDKIKFTFQEMFNLSFDPDFNQNTVEIMGFDGQNLQRLPAGNFATKKTVSGTTTYFAKAAPGTLQSTAKWQAFKLDKSSGLVITWADGDNNFDNIATDLTALTYS